MKPMNEGMNPMREDKKSSKMIVLALKSKDKKEPEQEEEESGEVESLEDMLDMVMESDGKEKDMAIDALIARLESLRD